MANLLPDFEVMVVKGILERIGQVFEVSGDAIDFYSSTNRMQLAQRIDQMRNGPQSTIKWPKVFVHLSDVGEATTEQSAYVPKILARQGVNVQMDDSAKSLVNVSFVPAAFSFEVTYMVDDFWKAFSFACGWVWHGTRKSFNFSISYASMDFDVQVLCDPHVSTPDRDESVSRPNVYEYTATMTVIGLISGKGEDGMRIVSRIGAIESTVSIETAPIANAAATSPVITIPL
jgi:hypothetical protein